MGAKVFSGTGESKYVEGEMSSYGCAVKPNGDITGVYSGVRGMSRELMLTAIDNGGDRLDAYAVENDTGEPGVLARIYHRAGFEPVARVPFVEEFARPGFVERQGTGMDIVFFAHNGDTAELVRTRFGTYPPPTREQYTALPVMEYNEAAAFRDSLIASRRKDSATPRLKVKTAILARKRDAGEEDELDGVKGVWRTVNGARLFVASEDGRVVAGAEGKFNGMTLEEVGTGQAGLATGAGHVTSDELQSSLPPTWGDDRKSKLVREIQRWSMVGYVDVRENPDGEAATLLNDAIDDSRAKWSEGSLFRGVVMKSSELEDLLSRETTNQKGVSSWSSDMNIAIGFTDKFEGDDVSVLFVEDSSPVKTAVSISNLSDFPDEREVIYSGRVSFRILGHETSDDLVTVRLQEERVVKENR